MMYARMSNPKKTIAFLTSLFIHLMIMIALSLSFENISRNKQKKDFDLYAIKLLNVKPKKKDKLNSKPDSKKGKLIRKKKNNKAFPQKGKRQALAPKAPLENLKKTARANMKNKNVTPNKVNLEKQQDINKTAKLESIKRQLDLKQKLVEESQKKLAKLEKRNPLKKYKTTHKTINKKQITPLKKVNQQQAENKTQRRFDKLKRQQTPKPKNDFSKVKINFKNQPKIPQEDKKIKLTAQKKQPAKLNKRVDYQKKLLTTKKVEISQRQLITSSQSVPVVRKMAIAPNKVLTEITQTFTKLKQVETFTRMTRKTTSVTSKNSPEVLRDFKLAPSPAKTIERQTRPVKPTTISQQSTPMRAINYQQRQVQEKPVQLAQVKLAYNRQTKMVSRKTNTPAMLNVATPNNSKAVPPQTFQTMIRKNTSLKNVPQTSTSVLTSELALEAIKSKSIKRQTTMRQPTTTVSKKIQFERTMPYQQKQVQEPVKLTQARVTYNQQTQALNRTVNGPATLDVSTKATSQTAQSQTFQAMNRQHTSVKNVSPSSPSVLSNEFALAPIKSKPIKRQANMSQTTSIVSQKIQFERTISYQQRQVQESVELTQVRVAYNQQTKTRSRSANVAGPAALDIASSTEPQAAQTQAFGAVSRQSTSLANTAQATAAVLSSPGMLAETSAAEFGDKQVQLAKLETATEKFVVTGRVEFGQRSNAATPTKMVQQRVSYQQAAQGVNERFLDQPTDLSGAVAQATGQPSAPGAASAVATISRQESASSAATSTNSFVLETHRYATSENSAVGNVKTRRRSVNLSGSLQTETGGQQRSLTVAYATESASKSSIGIGAFSTTTGSNSLHGSPTSPMLSGRGTAVSGEKNAPVIKTDLPSGNITDETLYRLRGEVDGNVKQAFITVNDVTQLVAIVNGKFDVEVAMVKGINQISILAFDSSGNIGKQNLKLLYNPPPGVPLVQLESPRNGKQGVKEGDPIIVSGSIDNRAITRATLLLNGIPIKLKVLNGRFKKKIFMPNTRITTFRVMAQNKNSPPGYSALHTILAGYDIDIVNPRPY